MKEGDFQKNMLHAPACLKWLQRADPWGCKANLQLARQRKIGLPSDELHFEVINIVPN